MPTYKVKTCSDCPFIYTVIYPIGGRFKVRSQCTHPEAEDTDIVCNTEKQRESGCPLKEDDPVTIQIANR